MRSLSILAWLLLLLNSAGFAQSRQKPDYSLDTILNAASGTPDLYSPNTLLAIHGSALANAFVEIDLESVKEIPTLIVGSGTRVYIRNQLAGMISAAPDQLLVLVPPDLVPGTGNIQVIVDGLAGPAIPVRIRPVSPAMFLRAEGLAAATREDTSDVTPELPAVPGEKVTFYATGLGPTKPAADGLAILRKQAPLTHALQVLFDGTAVDTSAIEYAGVQMGAVGTYRIRCRIPEGTSELPEIRLLIDGQLSQEGLHVPVRTAAPEPSPESAPRKLATSTSPMTGSPGAVASSRPRRIQSSSSPTRE